MGNWESAQQRPLASQNGLVQETVDDVLADLNQMLRRAAAAHAFSTFGIVQVDRQVAAGPRSADNPDPAVYIGIGDPNDPASTQYAKFRASELPALLANGGPIATQLGQQWAVFVFTEWEDNFRGRLAAAQSCRLDEIRADVFGDLRLMRNDILHNRASASKDRTGRCKILRWFQPGEEVVIKGEHIAEFMGLVPWGDLKKGPVS
jgi:hypothetical protein